MDFLHAAARDDPGQVWYDSPDCTAVIGELNIFPLSCTVTLDINRFTESHAGTGGILSQQKGEGSQPVCT